MFHKQNLIGNCFYIACDVGGDQHDFVLCQVLNISAQAHPLLRVKACGRFIQQQNLRLAKHGLRQHDPLPHTAGKATDLSVRCAFQVHNGKQFPDLWQGVFLFQTLDLCHVTKKIVCGHLFIHSLTLRHETENFAERLAQRQNVRAVIQNFAALPLDAVGNQVHECGFSGAVWPQNRRNAGREGVGKIVQRRLCTVCFGKMVDFKLHYVSPL